MVKPVRQGLLQRFESQSTENLGGGVVPSPHLRVQGADERFDGRLIPATP
jgi:hypothetical protein